MPSLLLQKPSQKSKLKDHLRALERRLELWELGEVMELLKESDTIQKNMKATNKTTSINEISGKFTREMRKGNIHNAMKLLTNNLKNGVLPLNKKTLEQLKQKYPQRRDADPEIMLPDKPEEIHPIKFDSIDAENVRKAALKTRGGIGASGLDADGWQRIFTSNQFGDSTDDLRKTFAEVIKKLCTVENQSTSLEAFLANRLIPLDKNPEIRPIGVGEVLRRLAGKVIVSHLKEDVIQSVGLLQVCAGQDAGCESLIHAMRTKYEDQSAKAVLLVDASNAFNSINRNVFLHNVEVICPSIPRYVKNCYSLNCRLFIIGGGEIQSMEGTTQGDPAAMVIYAIAIIPLILMLVEIRMQDNNHTKTTAYADDLTVAGPIDQIRIWWNTLCRLGPKFGYFPEGSKSWITVRENAKERAQTIFDNKKIKITTDGQRHLGAVTGTANFKQNYMKEKINQWIQELRILSKIAWYEPQSAYSCFITGFKHKPTYFIRTIPNIGKEVKQLDDVARTEFIPAITGGINCSDLERKLLSFPPKLGGLGIPIFSETAEREYKFSTMISKDLTSRIVNQHCQHQSNENINQIKNKVKLMKLQHHQEQLNELRLKFNDQQKRLNGLNQEQGASSWLTILPILDEGYDLTKQLFWDLIRIRYGWILTRLPLPTNCECGTKFDI